MAARWTALQNPPTFDVSTMLLLLDGTVMAQELTQNKYGKNWWRLTPDSYGSYVNGSWSACSPMHTARLYFASAVLSDGRVLVAGGEDSDDVGDTNRVEVYDPANDQWTELSPPPNWSEIGDAPCAVLADGRLLLGQINGLSTAIFDPHANTWAAGPLKGDASAEESWVLLPDGSVITVQCTGHPNAERYVPSANAWVPAGRTPTDLVEAASIEIGAGILLTDGRAFFIGATPHSALFNPPRHATDLGNWVAGPDIPLDPNGQRCGAKDAPACLMINGHVLLTVGPVNDASGDYLGPTYFYEFDGLHLARVDDPPNRADAPYLGRMLLLPTGEILYAACTASLYVYAAPVGVQDAWRPTVASVSKHLWAGTSFTLTGTQLNGLSQAVGYGDDAAAATNYPLVRLRDGGGTVFYCRTFGHSSMGVATGASMETTNFFVPHRVPPGDYALELVANGIASQPVPVHVNPAQLLGDWSSQWQWLMGQLADGPLWAIGPHGPVPVDPQERESSAQIHAARQGILEGVRSLQELGGRMHAVRHGHAAHDRPVEK